MYVLYQCLSILFTLSVEKPKIHYHQKIFRETNTLETSLVKTLISRIFCQKRMRVNLRNFHTVLLYFRLHAGKAVPQTCFCQPHKERLTRCTPGNTDHEKSPKT